MSDSKLQSLGSLGSKAKQIVANVAMSFLQESKKQTSPAIRRTVEATGVSRTKVFKIRKEQVNTGVLRSPKCSGRGPYKLVDDFDQTVISIKIQEFYTVRRQLPTLKSLHEVLKTDVDFPGSFNWLRKEVLNLGYRLKRTKDNRKVLVEEPAIICQRLTIYNRKQDLEQNGFRLVYINETWIDTAYTAKRCWQSKDTDGVLSPCNRGQRLIVVHAVYEDRFIPGARLIYKAALCTGDYRNEMNKKNFTKWLEEMLLPNPPGWTKRDCHGQRQLTYHAVRQESNIKHTLSRHTGTYKVKSKH